MQTSRKSCFQLTEHGSQFKLNKLTSFDPGISLAGFAYYDNASRRGVIKPLADAQAPIAQPAVHGPEWSSMPARLGPLGSAPAPNSATWQRTHGWHPRTRHAEPLADDRRRDDVFILDGLLQVLAVLARVPPECPISSSRRSWRDRSPPCWPGYLPASFPILPSSEVPSTRVPCTDDPADPGTVRVDQDIGTTINFADCPDPLFAIVPPPVDRLDRRTFARHSPSRGRAPGCRFVLRRIAIEFHDVI